MNNNDEQIVWSASQSQASHFVAYALLVISLFVVSAGGTWVSSLGRIESRLVLLVSIAMASLGLFCILSIYLTTKYTKYTLTSQRLQTHTGVFSKQTDDMELYRVIDTRLVQPFILRLFGLGNVTLITADSTSPKLSIIAIKDAAAVRDTIRNLVETTRRAKNIREFI